MSGSGMATLKVVKHADAASNTVATRSSAYSAVRCFLLTAGSQTTSAEEPIVLHKSVCRRQGCAAGFNLKKAAPAGAAGGTTACGRASAFSAGNWTSVASSLVLTRPLHPLTGAACHSSLRRARRFQRSASGTVRSAAVDAATSTPARGAVDGDRARRRHRPVVHCRLRRIRPIPSPPQVLHRPPGTAGYPSCSVPRTAPGQPAIAGHTANHGCSHCACKSHHGSHRRRCHSRSGRPTGAQNRV